jgi:carboxypeptidase C (cathepsin A)
MRSLFAVLSMALLASCGGGGGAASGGGSGGGSNDLDPNVYSSAPAASLSTPNEIVATTQGSLALASGTIAYTATAGHLTAKTSTGAAEASFFYAAYTKDGADAATRPLTILFNGGPGSASAWLHLGSWGPRRISTGVPVIGNNGFPWVTNQESLLDTTDLVFVDAPGTGLSEAITPNTNQTFWGVDADAAVFRDFVVAFLSARGRTASPLFLYGESYGTVRAPVLARLLESAGVPVAGVVLQSSVLDYNTSCSEAAVSVNCEGSLPSYSAVGDFFDLVSPPPGDLDAFLRQVRIYADTVYGPEVDTWISEGSPSHAPPGADLPALQDLTGLPATDWNAQFNMDYDTFRHALVPGMTLGVYDGRMEAPAGSQLGQGDPSNDYVEPAFQAEIAQMLPDDLGYTNASGYVLLSDAIETWNFSHDGLAFPDVVPDLATALALDPQMKVLQLGGDHDLITPFHQAERDLARLPDGTPVTYAFHPGGHMTYLDDTSRPLMKADLVAFYASAAGAR